MLLNIRKKIKTLRKSTPENGYRNLGQCICVKYCRETESVLVWEDDNEQ